MGIIADIHEDLEKGALQLIVEYRGRLQAEAMRLCHDATAADDLVMRTFETVLFRIDKYRPDGNLFGWMKSILTSLHFNDGLRAVNRNTTPAELDELEKLVPEDNSTLEEIMRNSDGEAVREALNRIDPKYREALVLHYFKDYSFREISSILKLPLGTVGRRMQIARQILADKLRAEFRAGGRKFAFLAAFLLAGSLLGAVTLGVVEALRLVGGEEPAAAETALGSLGSEGSLGTGADPIDPNPDSIDPNPDSNVSNPDFNVPHSAPNSPTTLSTTENTNAKEEETMVRQASLAELVE